MHSPSKIPPPALSMKLIKTEVKSMNISDMKKELKSKGISTRHFIEKVELVRALVQARTNPGSNKKRNTAVEDSTKQSAGVSVSGPLHTHIVDRVPGAGPRRSTQKPAVVRQQPFTSTIPRASKPKKTIESLLSSLNTSNLKPDPFGSHALDLETLEESTVYSTRAIKSGLERQCHVSKSSTNQVHAKSLPTYESSCNPPNELAVPVSHSQQRVNDKITTRYACPPQQHPQRCSQHKQQPQQTKHSRAKSTVTAPSSNQPQQEANSPNRKNRIGSSSPAIGLVPRSNSAGKAGSLSSSSEDTKPNNTRRNVRGVSAAKEIIANSRQSVIHTKNNPIGKSLRFNRHQPMDQRNDAPRTKQVSFSKTIQVDSIP